MNNNISKRDWETISAYLDGQLSPGKRARLESRLANNQQLQSALDEMRNTRQILRNTPQLRAPRSYMLTPEMAGQPRRLPRLAPMFGWASAVASFLFVLFLVGDMFTSGGAIPMALTNLPNQELVVAPKGNVPQEDLEGQQAFSLEEVEITQPEALEAAAPAEVQEEEPVLEAAIAPTPSVTAGEENASASKSIDMIAEEDQSATPEPNAEGTPLFDAGVALVDSTPTEEPRMEDPGSESPGAEEADPQETLPSTNTSEEHLLVPPVEETEPPTEAPDLPDPEVDVTEGAEQWFSPTETFASEVETTQTPFSPFQSGEAQTQDNLGDFLIGAEVMLALIALGAGLAWLYLRQRGG